MPKTRPFTYNNQLDPIEGNFQIGNLAYGPLNEVNEGDDYSGDPGSKKWWMGPDEDSKYIIGKDVPAGNWPTPTPEGNIGSVRFWGGNQTDNDFLIISNKIPARIGQPLFETPKEAYGWLIDNGYYTNYPYIGFETSSLWSRFNVRNASGNIFNQIVFYNSSSDSVIAGYGTIAGSGVKGPYHITSSYFTTGSNLTFGYTSTNILPGNSNYDSFEGSYVALDYTNSKLYTTFGTANDNQTYIVRYDLDTNTADLSTTLGLGKFSSSYYNNDIVYNSYNNRVYLPYTDYDKSPEVNQVYVYNSTNLNYLGNINFIATSSASDKGFPQLSPNPSNGEILQLNSSRIPNRFTFWNFNDISNPSWERYSPSINWRLTSPLKPLSATAYSPINTPFPFSPSQNKFYIPGFQTGSTYASLNGNGNAMLVLDANTREVSDIIYLGGSGFGTSRYMLYNVGVYDEKRDYVWTFNLDDKLVAVNCATNKVIGEFEVEGFQNNEGGFGADWYTISSLAIDNNNDRLFYAPQYQNQGAMQIFDLTDAISQLP